MEKINNVKPPKQSDHDILDNLINLLEKEGSTEAPSLQELYDQLYKSLYIMRDFSSEFEAQKRNSLKSRILKIYRSMWRIGANPYIRYHNHFHALLINTIFVQNALIKELESKINQRTSKEC